VKSSRPKVEPIQQPNLFGMEKLEETGKLANSLNGERPYSLPRTGIFLGTSAFTAAEWEGSANVIAYAMKESWFAGFEEGRKYPFKESK